MRYIDGFVTPVASARKDEYIAFARATWPLFREYGAISLRECWGDHVPDGELTSFPMAVQKRDEETVVFSWIEWPDRTTRDAWAASLDTDPRWSELFNENMPFDGKRMLYGSFDVIFEAEGRG